MILISQHVTIHKRKMLHGIFENGFPCIDVIVVGKTEKTVRAVIDTGFNGYFTLPESVAISLGLEFIGVGSARLANGMRSPYKSYNARLLLGDKRINVVVDTQQNSPALIGNKLLHDMNMLLSLHIKNETVELEEK